VFNQQWVNANKKQIVGMIVTHMKTGVGPTFEMCCVKYTLNSGQCPT